MRTSQKHTDIGVIPNDWGISKLGEVCDVRDGTHDSPKYHDKGFPFITSKNLKENGLDFSDVKYISEIDHRNFSKRSKVDKGDILFGMIGTIGNPVIVDTDSEFSIKNVALLKFSNNHLLDSVFALNILKSSIVLKQFSRESNGGVLKFVALGNIRNLIFPIPPLSEQQKIAEILSTIDEKLEVIAEQIEQTQKLKKGLMQRLLTKGIGHTQFKDSPFGRIPESWQVRELNEVTSYVDYRGKTPPKVEKGTFLVTAKNIRNDRINYDVSKEYVPTKLYNEIMSRGKLALGDVLITTEAPLGEVATIDDVNVALAQRVIKYRGKHDILDNKYLKYCLLSPYFQELLYLESTGSTVKGIKGSRLHKLKILIPPINEQSLLAEIFSTVDEKIDVLSEKHIQYQGLKKGLMQELLTGKLRVNHLIEQTELV